nr:hypothetical protein [Kibdelosporangium sp. MJ126-NF4]
MTRTAGHRHLNRSYFRVKQILLLPFPRWPVTGKVADGRQGPGMVG